MLSGSASVLVLSRCACALIAGASRGYLTNLRQLSWQGSDQVSKALPRRLQGQQVYCMHRVPVFLKDWSVSFAADWVQSAVQARSTPIVTTEMQAESC